MNTQVDDHGHAGNYGNRPDENCLNPGDGKFATIVAGDISSPTLSKKKKKRLKSSECDKDEKIKTGYLSVVCT